MDDGERRQVLDIVIKPGFMDKWYGQTKASAYASENYRASANLHYLTDRDPFNVYAVYHLLISIYHFCGRISVRIIIVIVISNL